jgi:hypothetical protein
MFMRRLSPRLARTLLAVVFLAGSFVSSPHSSAVAQDQNNPEVLRKELADALAQLKAAQDRKNELATENDKLKAQIAAMQKDVDEVRRAQATWAEQSYFLRAQQAAWNDFLERYPRLRAEWEMFLAAGPFAPSNELPKWADPLAIIATTQNGTPATSAATTSAPVTSAPATTMNSPATLPATTTAPAAPPPSTTTAPATTQPATTRG